MLEQHKKSILKYLKENIEDFELKADLATNIMYKDRYPLACADTSLFNLMYDYATEWCEDNIECDDRAEWEDELDEYYLENLLFEEE